MFQCAETRFCAILYGQYCTWSGWILNWTLYFEENKPFLPSSRWAFFCWKLNLIIRRSIALRIYSYTVPCTIYCLYQIFYDFYLVCCRTESLGLLWLSLVTIWNHSSNEFVYILYLMIGQEIIKYGTTGFRLQGQIQCCMLYPVHRVLTTFGPVPLVRSLYTRIIRLQL